VTSRSRQGLTTGCALRAVEDTTSSRSASSRDRMICRILDALADTSPFPETEAGAVRWGASSSRSRWIAVDACISSNPHRHCACGPSMLPAGRSCPLPLSGASEILEMARTMLTRRGATGSERTRTRREDKRRRTHLKWRRQARGCTRNELQRAEARQECRPPLLL
jgi:hypothetical protein